MEFGRRSSAPNDDAPAAAQETCVRCYGTGRVRERGNRLICKACAGTGRTTVGDDRTSRNPD
jgi:DnaJ-class molecular chaperone